MSSSGLQTGVSGTKGSSFGRLPSAEEPVRVLAGDAVTMLQSLPDGCVQCAITSPPYWGLRDYKLAPQVWGESGGCDHQWEEPLPHGRRGNRGVSGTGGNLHPTLDRSGQGAGAGGGGQFCSECRAWRGCLGMEPTADLYVEHMVAIFREVKRVLRKDGTFWLNMGDSYAQGGKPATAAELATDRERAAVKGYATEAYAGYAGWNRAAGTAGGLLKEKDLIMMPHRLALALQKDGWWVRMDCVWQKPNPMPESCRDRPTRAHEYVFLLTKAAKYYYDPVAVREAVSGGAHSTGRASRPKRALINPAECRQFPTRDHDPAWGRNQRSVWTINARAYAGAHFSTFPPALVEPCLKAGTSARGCCPQCGAPWHRLTLKERQPDRPGRVQERCGDAEPHGPDGRSGSRHTLAIETTGWTPTCACRAYRLRVDLTPEERLMIMTRLAG